MVNVTRKFKFTHTQAYELFRLQGLANDAMSTAWRTSTNEEIAYYRAAYVEAAEALQSYGYKWWKQEKPNLQHVKMELIDILHFVISDDLRHFYSTVVSKYNPKLSDLDISIVMETRATEYFNRDFLDTTIVGDSLEDVSVQSLLDQFIEHTLKDRCGSWPMLALLFEKLEMSPNAVFGFYVGKNVLNRFRNEHGQKRGVYYRTWDEGMDDNDVLINYITDLDNCGEELTEDGIYEYLKYRYAEFLKTNFNTTLDAVLASD